jgi:hypothetical protein
MFTSMVKRNVNVLFTVYACAFQVFLELVEEKGNDIELVGLDEFNWSELLDRLLVKITQYPDVMNSIGKWLTFNYAMDLFMDQRSSFERCMELAGGGSCSVDV